MGASKNDEILLRGRGQGACSPRDEALLRWRDRQSAVLCRSPQQRCEGGVEETKSRLPARQCPLNCTPGTACVMCCVLMAMHCPGKVWAFTVTRECLLERALPRDSLRS